MERCRAAGVAAEQPCPEEEAACVVVLWWKA